LRNRRRARLWSNIATGAILVGVAAAIARTAGAIGFDIVGVIAATSFGSAMAWAETRQFRPLATAYSRAAHELGAVSITFDHVTDEDDWAEFVLETESVLSREHGTWLSRRGSRTARAVPGRSRPEVEKD
jgi:hypothetical protein